MKKKLFKIAGLAVCLCALVINVSKAFSNETQDVNLLDLANATEANAECYNKPYTNNGRCGMTGNCYALSSPVNCDSTANW